MFQKLLLKILTILIIPIFLFSDNIPETPIKLIGKDTSVTKPTIEPTIVTEDTTKNLENQIDIQNKLILKHNKNEKNYYYRFITSVFFGNLRSKFFRNEIRTYQQTGIADCYARSQCCDENIGRTVTKI